MRKLFTIIAFTFITTTTFAQLQAWNFNSGSNAPTSTAPGMTGNNAIFNGIGTASYITGYDISNPPTYFGGLAYASDGWSSSYFKCQKVHS